MEKLDFFKLQAKNLLRDYKTQFVNEEDGGIYDYKPKHFDITVINDIELSFDLEEASDFTLMNAQHIIAKLSGFDKWAELINATEERLKLGELLLYLYQANNSNIMTNIVPSVVVENWNMYLQQNNLDDVDDETKLRVFVRIFFINGADVYIRESDEVEACEQAILNGEYFKVVKWCREKLLPFMTRKSINPNHSSYGLKHNCEKEIKVYVSNGTLKLALYYLGVKGKRNPDNSPNYCYPIQESFFATASE